MFKFLAFGAIVSASVLATAIPSQARQISVWGNNFTTDEAPLAAPPALATPRFNATVAQPERYNRGVRRLHGVVR